MADKNVQYMTLLKPFARANSLPLTSDEVWESISAAEAYVNSPMAYAGQTIKVKLEDGKYQSFTLQPHKEEEKIKLVLEELKGVVDEDKLKKYVQLVDTLPETPETGVIYLTTTENTGHIWTGSEYKQVFGEVVVDVSNLAKLDGAEFTGSVVLAADPIKDMEAATKHYVDQVVAAGGSDPAEAIAQAKQEAIQESKSYSDSLMTWGTF
jgi:hypothetical protein